MDGLNHLISKPDIFPAPIAVPYPYTQVRVFTGTPVSEQNNTVVLTFLVGCTMETVVNLMWIFFLAMQSMKKETWLILVL